MNKLNTKQMNLIKQEIPLENGTSIVRLNVAADNTISEIDSNNNIYCINKDNEILWQINAAPSKFNRDSFVSILRDNDEVIAKRFFGLKYRINIKTGQAEECGWDK